MRVFGFSTALVAALLVSGAARGQSPSSAKVETAPLELTAPDRFQIHSVLEPLRRVAVMATADGVLRTMEAQVGATVKETQEIAQLDRAEAAARLKVAKAHVKEAEATLKGAVNKEYATVGQAQLEAAQARAELAQIDLDRCTLRAPFAGRLLATPVFDGQYVTKGTTIAELADVSSLRVLVPLDRATATVGGRVTVTVEGQPVEGKIKATLPLPETFAKLRELANTYAAAWVAIPNPKGEFEPGQRVLSSALPTAPIATVPAQAIKAAEDDKAASSVQVIRNDYVTNVRVKVLGHPGPERVQVCGPLRPTDALIVSTSIPLASGTLIRFSGAATSGTADASAPRPTAGAVADIAPPVGGTGRAGAAAPRTPPAARAATPPAATRPAPKPAAAVAPF